MSRRPRRVLNSRRKRRRNRLSLFPMPSTETLPVDVLPTEGGTDYKLNLWSTPKGGCKGSFQLQAELPVDPIELDNYTHWPTFTKCNFEKWLQTDWPAKWRAGGTISLLQWYHLTHNAEGKLFYNYSARERGHDPTFLKGWAAGVTRVYVKPPKRFRPSFTRVGNWYTLVCIPHLGVLRWLASLACRSPNSVQSVWNVQFKTVCKFNPYLISLLAIGGDACFPFVTKGKSPKSARDDLTTRLARIAKLMGLDNLDESDNSLGDNFSDSEEASEPEYTSRVYRFQR
jgi:hypothetical protein